MEGESDAQTLWLHGYCALGVPGATNFNAASDDTHLGRFARVVDIQEPGAGGGALARDFLKSKHSDRIHIAKLDGFKDVSELHVADPAHFNDRLDAAIALAVPLERWASKEEKPASVSTELRGWRSSRSLNTSASVMR